MKKVFSIFLFFCISIFSFSNININKNISQQTEYSNIKDASDITPTINYLTVNEQLSTSTSISLNWSINDPNRFVYSIQIKDSENKFSSRPNSNMLTANNYVIDGLSPNTNYNVELWIFWVDNAHGRFGNNVERVSVSTSNQIAAIPTITSFSSNQTQTTTNSVSLSWEIEDQNNIVDSIEIWDASTKVKLEKVDSTILVANDYVVDGLDSNTNYNLELRVYWSDSVSGFSDDVEKFTSVNTNAQVPTVDNFSLVSTKNNSVIIKVKYSDPDSIVDSITIHDKNGNINDVVFSPSDLVNNEYELKNIKSGDYDLELTLHWTSLNDENTIKYSQNLDFTFEKSMSAALISTISIIALLLLLLLLILLIVYLIKRSKNKQANKDNYYVEDENYYYEDGNNFYYENSQY